MSTTDAPNGCKDGAPMVYFPPHPTPPLGTYPALSLGSELSIEPQLLLVAKVAHCPAGRPLTCPLWAGNPDLCLLPQIAGGSDGHENLGKRKEAPETIKAAGSTASHTHGPNPRTWDFCSTEMGQVWVLSKDQAQPSDVMTAPAELTPLGTPPEGSPF